MESGIANYLHKKFKKQLSIEPKLQHDKENKDSRTIEPREEKTECVSDRLLNDSVPNQSTNPNSPPVLNASSSSTNCKSSNSIENCVGNIPSSNSHISYLVCNNINNDSGQYDQNIFDTKPYTFSSIEATNTLVNSTSSIFNNVVYTKREDSPVEEVQDYSMKNDTSDVRVECREEVPPPAPDRTSGGKYVCTYCNLVCSKPSVLQKHIRAHTNERPYPCISCGFSFKTRSNLYKHCRSRTHANRVMGNKAQEGNNEPEVCKSIEPQFDISGNSDDQISVQDLKNKPYKPRFHTVNTDKVSRDYIDEEKERLMQQHANSDILSHHINEIINKNNSIVNSNESSLYKRRMSEMNVDNNNDYGSRLNRSDALYISTSVDPRGSTDEPLNLTKNRKRSISEVAEPVVQKSLIKELLLKNLSSDMQCKYCKMIFQTVTELELHKLRSCKGKPADSKYSRSTSVNVASILTKNKNAFDSIPQLQNTVFPLNSPGPFLGRTRLVDGDKSKSFSFDSGNLPLSSPTSEPAGTPYYLLSPISFEREKKTPVRMFGGEVKVHTSGETKSYRVADGDDNYNKEHGFLEYGGKLSENRVVKSSLQSGGTVLTNKTNYRKHESKTPQEVIKVYENTLISPSIDISNIRRFNFDQNQKDRTSNSTEVSSIPSNSADSLLVSPKTCNIPSPLGKYPNMMDFSQKAVKLLTPNLKQPYLSVSGFANRFIFDNLSDTKPQLSLQPAVDRRIEPLGLKRYSPNLKKELEERSVISKNSLSQKEGDKSPATPIDNIYNPMSLLVNGKVVRYVPGIPGPVVAGEGPAEPAAYVSNIIAVPTRKPTKQLPSPIPTVVVNEPPPSEEGEIFKLSKTFLQKIKKPIMDRMYKMPKLGGLEVKTDGIGIDTNEMRSPSKISDLRSPNNTVTTSVEQKKFARPNSLALKPTTASLKQHHGLTPTLFNQILISPDTPRVAKKYAQHFLHGNYFSYLGLKSSTKPVYCTLNKTQPFYVPHFKKLSMYSEWRQQDTKTDKLYVSSYDSRQKSQNYTTAGKTTADLIIHSSYKFVISEVPSNKTDKNQEDQRPSVLGGYECNDDYTYIRGRGRGRYVCDQCGIRCKKPSMLKKHIRTHSNDRPYTCSHCNFSFKTKGNLTKHMKSKAHTKNYAASSGSGSSTQLSGTQSSESDTDDSGMDSSDESTTRQQEHEAAYGLLSLSQKTTQTGHHNPLSNKHSQSIIGGNNSVGSSDMFMTNEEINHVSKTNYAKNKILDQASSYTKKLSEITPVNMDCEESPSESQNICSFLGKTSATRPLTYPYTSVLTAEDDNKNSETLTEKDQFIKNDSLNVNADNNQHKSIKQFHVIQKYALPMQEPKGKSPMIEYKNISSSISKVPTLKVNDVVVQENNERKRKFSVIENTFKPKTQKSDEVMDLSMTTDKNLKINGTITGNIEKLKKYSNESYLQSSNIVKPAQSYTIDSDSTYNNKMEEINNLKNLEFDTKDLHKSNGSVLLLKPVQVEEQTYSDKEEPIRSNERRNCTEYDNSAMETLAEVATKQVKLEKNTLAKSVASEFLKLATKNENIDADRESSNYIPINKDVNELIVKPEGNKSCTICSKTFSRPSQLRLHMNIHYLERPFRCDSCSVSFRTKGHLQKHERSASHHSKLSSSPAQASSEPRPFKCSDCNIAFRIHGHLAKHLRSKMHIMKLECLAKIPFGLYAELERSNSLLTEINTCDADQCLESLKTLADKVLINDPSKLQSLGINQPIDVRGITDTDS